MTAFTLGSPEFSDLAWLECAHEFNGFDGRGENRSPALNWTGAPLATKSYALTLYDPDALTGSGFWHWVAYDIPGDEQGLRQGAGSSGEFDLSGSVGRQATNDFGRIGFGGPCPPCGDSPHRYVFSLHALGVEQLGAQSDTPNPVVRYLIHQHTLATARLIAHYRR